MKLKNWTTWSAASGCAATIALLSGYVSADNPGGWEYTISPYVWAQSISGEAGMGGKVLPLELDFEDDILENLDAAFALHIEATQGDLTLFADYNYAKLKPSASETFGPLGNVKIAVDVDFRNVIGEAGVAYAFYNSDAVRWEVLGGLRYMDQELEVDLSRPGIILPPVLPNPIKGGDDWWHGFGGFRLTAQLSEKWSLRARADLGYQDTNNKATNVDASFNYRFRDWGAFHIGYHYLDVDYDNRDDGLDGYIYDAAYEGPVLGMNIYL